MNKYELIILNEMQYGKNCIKSIIGARIDNLIYIIKIINLKIMLLYLSGFYIYFYSLTPITGVKMSCFKWKGVKCYDSLAILIVIASIFISISIFLIINLKYSKFHLLFIIIITIFLFLLDHEDGLQKHGFFNSILFTLLTLLIYCLLCFLKFLHYLYKKNIIIGKKD